MFWFGISDKLTRKGTFLCGVVYIPPQNSDYAAENPYDEIEREMNRLSANCEYVLLLRDNSRTKNLIDYIVPDSDIFESINWRKIFEELLSDMDYFDESEYFSLHRQNSDLGVNKYGYQMTEFCKDNNLYILNGRCTIDSGKTQCKSFSAIDYFVSSLNILPLLQTLYVHGFCPLLSDSHNAVSLVMTVLCSQVKTTSAENIKKQPKLWWPEKTDAFVNNFDVNKIVELSNGLSELRGRNDIVQDDMNSLVNSLNNVILKIANILLEQLQKNPNRKTPIKMQNGLTKVVKLQEKIS